MEESYQPSNTRYHLEVRQSEVPLYGSARLGLHLTDRIIRRYYTDGDDDARYDKVDPSVPTLATGPITSHSREVGHKAYELPNHLGNVLATVSDRKWPVFSEPKPGKWQFEHFQAELLSASEYYPFGMEMPGRIASSESYRYGFNGKEKDDEVKGSGVQYDYGFRVYDARMGKFLSVDPLSPSYPWYTPYQFAGNKPVWAIDLDGLEEYVYQYTLVGNEATLLRKIKNSEVSVARMSGNMGSADLSGELLIDKRTGKWFPRAERGTVQYQYFDMEGNRLDIRRDIHGNYVEGENEIMALGDDNYFGSIYIGPNNPTVIIDGEEKPDYRREPQDEVDAAALKHDQAYDKENAAGLNGALFNRKVRDADLDLVNSANQTAQNGSSGETDLVTGQPVTAETAWRAKAVAKFFILPSF